MNKNRGFTLVELIAAVVILSVILVMAIPAVNRLITKNKNKAYEGKIDIILKQAKVYARDDEDFIYNSNRSYKHYPCNIITIGELKEAGYLVQLSDEDGSKTTIKDPRTNKSMEDKKIMVYIKSSQSTGNDVYSGTIVTTDKDVNRCDTSSAAFAYSGKEEVFNITKTGKYKLEVWGAQGGDGAKNYIGGYGAYATGEVNLTSGDKLYINVGGQGSTTTEPEKVIRGGYNGGGIAIFKGDSSCEFFTSGSGGGATSIATFSGLLENLSTNQNKILIVAAGGGGSGYCYSEGLKPRGFGGSAGGIKGNDAYNNAGDYSNLSGLGATQSSGGCRKDGTACSSFGTANKIGSVSPCSGGGGGYYGGAPGRDNGAGGGSSYIGNSLLTNKSMYCYNCDESNETSTKTISVECTSKSPEENCAKRGSGYAKITFVE